MQWKKAQLALQVLHYLLLNGPVTAITEAMDGFASIRILKSYTETMRGQNAKLVRDAATEVYMLLVDTSVLFARRRECMNARQLAKDPRPSPLVKEIRMIKGIQSFPICCPDVWRSEPQHHPGGILKRRLIKCVKIVLRLDLVYP